MSSDSGHRQAHGHWDHSRGLPTFPLNTDGFDPAATNVLIERVNLTSFDDAVAVKPCRADGVYCTCSSNVLVRNAVVYWGVGMTIGSVPPNDRLNCVRNVTFEHIVFFQPFKAIYVKSNPGDNGKGLIQDITYRHITIHTPLWYPIWIGPQQQQQPGDHQGTGCSFFYPLNRTCATNPRGTRRRRSRAETPAWLFIRFVFGCLQ